MATFAYVGRTRGGQLVRGTGTADSAGALASMLRREQVLVTSIREARAARRGRVRNKPLSVFTRQLSVMIEAGLPLVQSLELLGGQEPDARLARAIASVRRDVEAGASLAEAMTRCPEAFDVLYTQMVAAGETAGILDEILRRVSVYLEKHARLKSQARSALTYPVTVLGIAAVVVFVILWKVIPTFTTLFEGLNAELPLPTRIVIWASRTLGVLLPFIAAAVAGLSFVVIRYYGRPVGRARIDAMLLALPFTGRIVRHVAVARFCRTFGTLVGAGVPLLDGLNITSKVAGNAVVESAILRVRSRVERGETIAAPLKTSGVFPPLVAQMIAAGETTGTLETMLGRVADFYEAEVDLAVSGLVAMLEPILIAVLGVVIGAIVVSLYLPLFSLISQLSTR
jgi:type IV pilus assembly protein PilC